MRVQGHLSSRANIAWLGEILVTLWESFYMRPKLWVSSSANRLGSHALWLSASATVFYSFAPSVHHFVGEMALYGYAYVSEFCEFGYQSTV